VLSRESGIYIIKNKANKKVYIGSAYNINRRISNHLNFLKKGKDNPLLQKDWNEFGEENFIFEILSFEKKENLMGAEKIYIKKYRSNEKDFGYNLTSGGQGTTCYKRTKEQLEKMKGRNHPNYGKPMSEEQKKKISTTRIERKIAVGENNPNYGKTFSSETRMKISKNHIDVSGNKNPRYGKKLGKSKSKYYGVSWSSRGNTWLVTVVENGKQVYIGRNKEEKKAGKLYDRYVIENGLNRPLNFN
jgi:group I intron endonuclease